MSASSCTFVDTAFTLSFNDPRLAITVLEKHISMAHTSFQTICHIVVFRIPSEHSAVHTEPGGWQSYLEDDEMPLTRSKVGLAGS